MNEFARLFTVSGLSLDRLRTFLRVAEAGNLAKAAKGDTTRQSQFSRQIKELEAFFGVALTRRVGRRIEITDEDRMNPVSNLLAPSIATGCTCRN